MLIREIMSSPAVTIRPDATVADATRVLDRFSVTTLPVVDDEGRLLGLIGEADVIGHLSTPDEHARGSRRADEDPLVGDVMTHRVLTADADDGVAEVVALMTGTTLKSIPVLRHERVLGVISRRDVVRALVRGDLDAGRAGEHVTA